MSAPPPAIIITIPLEGVVQIRPRYTEAEAQRMEDWLCSKPELRELYVCAYELSDLKRETAA